MDTKITLLTDENLEAWLDANEATRGRDHMLRLIRFWQEVQEGKRVIWAAWSGEGVFLGHISLQPVSHYPPFKQKNIPEIVDVWVQPEARRRNIGQRLLQKAIDTAREGNAPAIGMGVGITKSYGPAHVMYSKHGFMPDGTGLWVGGIQAGEKETVQLGADVILMWVKIF